MHPAAGTSLIVLALRLAQFYGPDNQLIEINPEEVVAIREPRSDSTEKHFHPEIHCVIFTTDHKWVGVKEDCKTVSERLQLSD